MVHYLAVRHSNTFKNSKGRVAFYKLPDDIVKKQWLAKIKREGKLRNPENCFVFNGQKTFLDQKSAIFKRSEVSQLLFAFT